MPRVDVRRMERGARPHTHVVLCRAGHDEYCATCSRHCNTCPPHCTNGRVRGNGRRQSQLLQPQIQGKDHGKEASEVNTRWETGVGMVETGTDILSTMSIWLGTNATATGSAHTATTIHYSVRNGAPCRLVRRHTSTTPRIKTPTSWHKHMYPLPPLKTIKEEGGSHSNIGEHIRTTPATQAKSHTPKHHDLLPHI